MKYLATLFLTCSVSAFGQELLYTYSGHVTDISQDSAGIIGASGIHVGDSLAVTFLVDFSRPGYYIQNDGTTVFPGSGPHDTIQYHYYYDRLLTDLPIHEKDGGSLNAPMDAASLHYAYDNFGIAQSFSSMGTQQGGSDNAYITLVKSDPLNATIWTWTVGDTFDANVLACDSQNQYSMLKGAVTLTGIQSVPEPSTIWLFGLAVMSCALRMHRR